MRKFYLLVLFYLAFICCFADAANETIYDVSAAYCLRFTWLGPTYDQTSTVNVTCDDYAGTPCIKPFIVTTDGSEPNITYMWENYNHTVIGCPLRSGFTCIKYTYTFDNAVVNSSYFCGKMIQNSENALSSGCFTQKDRGYTINACACQSIAGEMPCNASTINLPSFLSQSILISLLIFYFGSI